MARAKRHYIAGQVWHITHRCHKREFLLGFAKDRRRWLQWLFEAKRRYGLAILGLCGDVKSYPLAYEKLAALTSYDDYDSLRQSHREWVEASLADGNNVYDGQWTRSIAVGGEEFVEEIKERLGAKILGRRIRRVLGGYEFRDRTSSYITDLSLKKSDIGLGNTYNWNPFP